MMKIVIVHYNTPRLTIALLASLAKNGIDKDIIVFENSDYKPLDALDMFDYDLLDNTNGQIINFTSEIKQLNAENNMTPARINYEMNGVRYGSVKHALTIQWLIEKMNEDFFLLDSDILIKKDFRHVADNKQMFVGDCTTYRVLPFLLYLNSKLLLSNNIKFFDRRNIHPFCLGPTNDTGGSFFRECQTFGKDFRILNLNDYYVHYGSGSWREFFTRDKSWYQSNQNIDAMTFLRINKQLFM